MLVYQGFMQSVEIRSIFRDRPFSRLLFQDFGVFARESGESVAERASSLRRDNKLKKSPPGLGWRGLKAAEGGGSAGPTMTARLSFPRPA